MTDLATLTKAGAVRSMDFKTMKMFRSGTIHISDSFKKEHQIGIKNGVDFAWMPVDSKLDDNTISIPGQGFKRLVMVIVPIKEKQPKPVLFSSAKQLMSIRFVKQEDGKTIRLSEPKTEIRGIQTDVLLTNDTLGRFFPEAGSAHIELVERLPVTEIDVVTTGKKPKLITRKEVTAVFSLKFTNVVNKKAKETV